MHELLGTGIELALSKCEHIVVMEQVESIEDSS